MTTERKRQHTAAIEHATKTGCAVYRYHFLLSFSAEPFSAIAPSEAGAFRVLNAEKPGRLATYEDRTFCPLDSRAARMGVVPGIA